jgi:hypothetical protein
MRPTHDRQQGEGGQGSGVSGGGPVVSRRGQGTRSKELIGPELWTAASQERRSGLVGGGMAWG